jgi:hypothetical protein
MDWEKLGLDAAKGAATGTVVPGIGTALGAVGGVALDLAPELSRWLFGPNSDATVAAVQSAVKTVTGTDHPEAQLAALADPSTANDLRLQLAGIAAKQTAAADQAVQERIAAQLADVANARATAIQFSDSHSAMVWGAPVVSVVVLVTFGAVVSLALVRSIPPGTEPVLNLVLGSLGAMATSVVGYWVGSSAGSARKDVRLASIAERAVPNQAGPCP